MRLCARRIGRGSRYSRIAQLGAGVATYQDTDLLSATTYLYQVRAVLGADSSTWSNETLSHNQHHHPERAIQPLRQGNPLHPHPAYLDG